MTSASVPDIFIVLESRDTPDSRDIPSPAERGRHDLGDQLDRSEDEVVRRIDRMHLDRDVRRPGERAVGLERGDDIAWRAEMNIHGDDHRVNRITSGRTAQASRNT